MRDIREVIREEPLVRGQLLRLLADGPLSVPELSQSAGLPAEEVMVWLMGMRKYGFVAETDQDGEGYYRYAAVRVP
jgi:DNA-binding IclR family transcriptional regulator